MAKSKTSSESKAGARPAPLMCPFCLEADSLSSDVNDMNAIHCGNCVETFSPAEAVKRVKAVAAQVERWQSFADWVGSAPTSGRDTP